MVGFAFVLDWKDVQEKCALHTLSRTWRLGNTVLRARHNKASPVESILQHENGKLLIVGNCCDLFLCLPVCSCFCLFVCLFVLFLKLRLLAIR